MERKINFAAGPSMLPLEVLEEIQENLVCYKDSGMSVMEMSHRSPMYQEIFNDTKATLKRVMGIPDDYEIIFTQGGATEQFSAIPMNLMKTGKADYVLTGSFSKKAASEASKLGKVHIAYDGESNHFKHIPLQDELDLSEDADYVYITTNNTIYGTEWKYVPDTKSKVLVADMSSNILSKPVNVSKFGLIYAGAQKNMGIAGLAVVIVRKDLIETHKANIPILMEYDTQVKHDSMINTPPTFSIYVLGVMLHWLERQGGPEAMEKRNIEKAKLLYDIIDHSDFYMGRSDIHNRSLMNVTFNTPNTELDQLFIKEAKALNMENLAGHKESGGLRASIYNAMTYENVEILAKFMKDFENRNK